MAETADHKLVQMCLEGDNKAFDLLVKRYELPMFRTALGILNNHEAAKEVTQAGFVKSWEKLHTFNPEHKFYSWLYRIIVNEALNTARNNKYHSPLTLHKSGDDDPYTKVLKKEENEILTEAVNSLPELYKVVIQLRHFEELNYKEIAEVLDIEPKTVKSRLYTARLQLRKKLYDR